MAAPSFVDTNIFVYAQDGRDKDKRETAAQLLRNLTTQGSGVISTQVVQELCSICLKPEINLPHSELLMILRAALYPMLKHTPNFEFYTRALRLQAEESLSFYDALIVQAAIDLGCQTLYSEDLPAGQTYGGVTAVDPFKSGLE